MPIPESTNFSSLRPHRAKKNNDRAIRDLRAERIEKYTELHWQPQPIVNQTWLERKLLSGLSFDSCNELRYNTVEPETNFLLSFFYARHDARPP
jgi:hypothetical protein